MLVFYASLNVYATASALQKYVLSYLGENLFSYMPTTYKFPYTSNTHDSPWIIFIFVLRKCVGCKWVGEGCLHFESTLV